MATIIVHKETKIGPGEWSGMVEARITDADLTAAATSDTVAITGIPSDAFPIGAKLEVGQYVTGGSISACTVSVGDAGDPDSLMTATNIFDTTALGTLTGTQGAESLYDATPATAGSGFTCIATFALTGDNADQADTGKLAIYVPYRRIALKADGVG